MSNKKLTISINYMNAANEHENRYDVIWYHQIIQSEEDNTWNDDEALKNWAQSFYSDETKVISYDFSSDNEKFIELETV